MQVYDMRLKTHTGCKVIDILIVQENLYSCFIISNHFCIFLHQRVYKYSIAMLKLFIPWLKFLVLEILVHTTGFLALTGH